MLYVLYKLNINALQIIISHKKQTIVHRFLGHKNHTYVSRWFPSFPFPLGSFGKYAFGHVGTLNGGC